MDENIEHKIRNLKLKIFMVEKELAATQHTLGLGAWLRTGHPGQLAKSAERDRERLETKLKELREKLKELQPEAAAVSEAAPEPTAAEEPKPVTAKRTAKKTTTTKAATEEKKPARRGRKPKQTP